MKQILPALFFLILSLHVSAQTEWETLNPTPSYQTGLDVHFFSERTGYALTATELLETHDSGGNWQKKMPLYGASDFGFFEDLGYIVGNNGYVLKSSDSGNSWTQINTGSSEKYNTVNLIDINTVIISGSRSISRSSDGGKTWTTFPVGSYTINKTFFTSTTVGHAVCNGGFILKTIDGGKTWYETESTNIYPNDFFTVYFVNEKVGFATREHNEIFKTTDGGENWSQLRGTSDALYSFFFFDEQTGFASGEYGVIFKTVDGGNTWEWAGFQNGRIWFTGIMALYFVDENVGFGVGQRGRIIRTEDGGKTWSEYAPFYNDVSQLQFVTDDIGFISVGSTFYKTYDAGKSWEHLAAPANGSGIAGFDFINEQVGYANVGPGNYARSVFKTVDGGQTWTETNNGNSVVSESLRTINFIDEETGVISGGYNQRVVLKTEDGGDSWRRVEDQTFGGIQFVNEKTGYARRVGNAFNRIYKTEDAGDTWEVVFEIEEDITSFHFVDESYGYLVGDEGLIYKTKDGGNSWEELGLPYGYYELVKFYSRNVGYVADKDGQILQTINGGFSWQRITSLYGTRSILLNNEKIYLSGSNGKILRSGVSYNTIALTAAPVREISNSSALLTGNVTSNNGKIDNIRFEYGTDYKFDQSVDVNPSIVESGESATFSSAISNLTPGTTYQVRIKGRTEGGDRFSHIVEFRTLEDYNISLSYPSLEGFNNVRVRASVVSNESALTDIEFQYGTEEGSFDQSFAASPSVIEGETSSYVEARLTELAPATIYYLRLKAIHENEEVYSNTVSFTTWPEYEFRLYAPQIENNNVSLSAHVTALKQDITELVFQYGSREFENEIKADPDQVSTVYSRSVSTSLSDLDPDKTYYYRIKGMLGEKEIYSQVALFNTSKEPIVVPDGANSNKDESVTVKGLINPGGKFLSNIQFEYGLTEAYGQTVSAQPATLTGSNTATVSASLTDLVPGATYKFRVKAVEGQATIHSEASEFHTKESVVISEDVLSLQVTNETCRGKANGSLLIKAAEEHRFRALINGEEHYFTSHLLLENLAAGDYSVCVTAPASPEFLQCFEFSVVEGGFLTGKVRVEQKGSFTTAYVDMEQGTAPFRVHLNGNLVSQFESSGFEVQVKQGDELEVSSSAPCEGKFALTIDQVNLKAFPNPASSILNIASQFGNKQAVQVDIYNNSGQLISSKEYQVKAGLLAMPVDALVPGIYFAVLRLEAPQTIKFSKR